MEYFYTYHGDTLYYAKVATESDFMKLYKRDVFGKLDQGERVYPSLNVPVVKGRANVKKVIKLQ